MVVFMGFFDEAKTTYQNSKKQYSLINQVTSPCIEILRYDTSTKSLKSKVLLSQSTISKRTINIDTLQSYSFSRGIDNLDGSFTLRLKDKFVNGNNVFDTIENFDIVKIKENVNRSPYSVDFVGVVHSVKISSSIGSDGKVRKEISISGKSAISLFSDCFINLGRVGTTLYNIDAANIKIKDTFTETSKKDGKLCFKAKTLRKIVEDSWAGFEEYLSGYYKAVSSTTLMGIIKSLGMTDFSNVENIEHQIPISTDLFGEESVSFMSMLRKIFPEGAYQFYSKDDTSLTIKENPYCAEKWKSLTNKTVNLNLLTNYDFEKTDREVYTVFLTQVEGSAIDSEFVAKLSANESGLIQSMTSKTEKIAKYGYKPLTVSFLGYVQNKAVDSSDDKQIFETFNKKLKEWYEHIDELLAGKVKIVNAYEKQDDIPKIGEKLIFMLYNNKIQKTEFYIKSETHSWSYGSSPVIEYIVERGAVYSNTGSFQEMSKGFSTSLEIALGNKKSDSEV